MAVRLTIYQRRRFSDVALDPNELSQTKRDALEGVQTYLREGSIPEALLSLPEPWIFASPIPEPWESATKEPEWRRNDVIWRWDFAIRILKHVPARQIIADEQFREPFLVFIEGLLTWTLKSRQVPDEDDEWEEGDTSASIRFPRICRNESSPHSQWDNALMHWLAHLTTHIDGSEFICRFLKPVIGAPDDVAIDLLHPFCSVFVCLGVYDAEGVTADTVNILEACRDRVLRTKDLARARQIGRVYGWNLGPLLRDLLFDFPDSAPKSTRFANGDWSQVASVIPLFDPIVRQYGTVQTVTTSFLTLCEKAADYYPVQIFVDQVQALLEGSEGIPPGWYDTSYPNRIGALIQYFAAKSAPLPPAMAQQMLRILDRLVDMGSRRAAAIQTNVIFKDVRVGTNSS